MLRTAPLYPLYRELERHLPSIQGRLRRGLALWLRGLLLACNGCRDSVAAALEAHGRFETVRRELREWTCDDGDRICSWGPATEVDAAACFPELLRWVQALWTPCEEGDGTEPSRVLALDPTHPRDEWAALVVSVVYRSHAIPVAWQVVEAQARESWLAHFERLLRQLAPAVPEGMPVHVLCDRGLDSRDLWRPIVELGWHPVLRYPPHITFRPTGSERVPVRTLGGGPGTLWVGAGKAFGQDPLPATLVVLHAPKQKDPWVLLTDPPPAETDADLYACRHWIEQGFRGPGGAAGSGDGRAGGTPCAWPGTCWPWPWPRCWRSPTAPVASRPPSAAGHRAACAVRPRRPTRTRSSRAASACCGRARPASGACGSATASGSGFG